MEIEIKNKNFFRVKKNKEKIIEIFQYLYGHAPTLHYDLESKFWWIQACGCQPFPNGVWRRADAVLYDDYPKAIAVRGTSLAKVFLRRHIMTIEDYVREAFKFLEEAGVDLLSYEDIHDGYLSLYELVLDILDDSDIPYDENISELIQKVFEAYKQNIGGHVS